MSQRLIRPGLLAVGLMDRQDPWWLTGGLVPLRLPQFAASEEDDGGSDDPDDDRFQDPPPKSRKDDDDEEVEDDDEEEDKPKSKKKGKKQEEDEEEDEDEEDESRVTPRSSRQAARYRAQLREAQAARDKLEQRLRAIEDKGKPAEEIKDRELTAAQSKVTELTDSVRNLRLQNAFLASNVVTWVDPEDALRLVDLSDVHVDDDGTVDRRDLRVALRDLARRKPHLVKKAAPKKASGSDDDADEEDDQGSGGKSAATMNGKRKGRRTTADREALAAKFPVLRRR